MSALPLLRDTAENCRKEERGCFQPGSPGKTTQRKKSLTWATAVSLWRREGVVGCGRRLEAWSSNWHQDSLGLSCQKACQKWDCLLSSYLKQNLHLPPVNVLHVFIIQWAAGSYAVGLPLPHLTWSSCWAWGLGVAWAGPPWDPRQPASAPKVNSFVEKQVFSSCI